MDSNMYNTLEDMESAADEVLNMEGEVQADSGHEAAKTSNVFHIDRTLIQEIEHDQQDEELQSLGLSVYHHEELEQGILQQVDLALEMQEREDERRKLDKQIQDVAEGIRSAEQQLSKDDALLQVMRGTPVSVTHAFKVRKDQEMRRNQLDSLRAKEKSLINKKIALDSGNQLLPEEGGSAMSGVLEKKEADESEQERMVRLGEMTPFGTILASRLMRPISPKIPKKEIKKVTELEKYLQSQAALDKGRTKPSASKATPVPKPGPKKFTPKASNIRENCSQGRGKSALKLSVLDPCKRKRKRKEDLGTKRRRNARSAGEPGAMASETQTIWLNDSDPDFLPDEEEDDESFKPVGVVPRKKKATVRQVRKRRSTTPMEGSGSEWGTDDSDWESSGDEEKVVKRRKGGREMDDGNAADYSARVKLWEREHKEEEKGMHQLAGGLEVPKIIWNKLYKYQQVGVQWMWELFQNGTGGILGDEMGLGKTIQVIAFMAALKVSRLRDKHTGFRGLGACIVVCPTTVMHQWVRELHTWWPPLRVAVLHDSGSFAGTRGSLIREISQSGGILITSYQGLVKHQEPLLSRSWHLLVLDEGHKIRNPDAQATLAAKRVPTPHRLALTGSPMQNNLRELWSLFDFVYPSKLGTLPDFMANFAVPITQGGYSNASEVQVATAYHCALSLKETIKPYLLRRMKSDVKTHINLPNKNEQVLFCKLTDEQRGLYQHYVDSRLVRNILEGKTQIFVGLINLRKICNHPDLFGGKSKLTQDDKELPQDERYGYWERSGKMAVVQSLLKIWHKQGHRVLLFTQGRQMMCILEYFVQQEGYKYLKLDGTTSIAARQPLIAKFNNDPSHFVFLLTTRVGGLGVNLTGANRVVIFDPDWNPATDTQARERAWRIGQKNQVTIYRLVTAGTIEEKIYHRQIFKQFLTNKVLKDPRQRRFFKTNDLYELFTLKEGNEKSTETSAIFAGTGSEVHVTKKPKRVERNPATIPQPVVPKKIKFSQEKIDHMKQLAQRLSQKIASKLINKSEANSEAVANGSNDVDIKSEENSMSGTAAISSSTESKKTENEPSTSKNLEWKTEAVASTSRSSENEAKPGHSKDHKYRKRKEEREERREKRREGREGRKHRGSKKGARFEGERVKHLVDYGDFAELLNNDEEEEEKKNRDENQDDYVLRKLFKKSGLQTALRHDTIMEGGGADYALVEREARHVAKEALARLKESQRQCFQAYAGIPTWTGNNGNIRAPRNSSEQRPKKPSAALGRAPVSTPTPEAKPERDPDPAVAEPEPQEEEEEGDELISGEDLITLWQKRNRLLRAPSPDRAPTPEQHSDPQYTDEEDMGAEEMDPMAGLDDDEEDEEQSEVPRPPAPESRPQVAPPSSQGSFVTEAETDLLDELRSFLAFGGSQNGQATTPELLERFPSNALPTDMSPLFKCLLQSIAEFHRNSADIGVWRLKPEFR